MIFPQIFAGALWWREISAECGAPLAAMQSPAGGVREATMGLAFGYAGLAANEGVNVSLLSGAVYFVVGAFGGLVWIFSAGKAAPGFAPIEFPRNGHAKAQGAAIRITIVGAARELQHNARMTPPHPSIRILKRSIS
jgi:hypothetical protein